jgi:hypothetical protein
MASFRQSLREFLLSFRSASPRRSSAHPRERGFELLTRNLSPAQRKQYARHGYFEVTGGDTGKCYRIRHGHQMNVELLDDNGRRSRMLCFMPRGSLPVGDIMLAQKLALELFETEALSIANRTPAWNYVLEEELGMTRRYHRF